MAKSINLDEFSVPELTALIEQATAKRDEKMEGAKQALREEMESRAAQLGLSIQGLFGTHSAPKGNTRAPKGSRKAAGASVAPKYQDKDGNTWTGRGRPPRWLADAEKAGAQRDSFLIG